MTMQPRTSYLARLQQTNLNYNFTRNNTATDYHHPSINNKFVNTNITDMENYHQHNHINNNENFDKKSISLSTSTTPAHCSYLAGDIHFETTLAIDRQLLMSRETTNKPPGLEQPIMTSGMLTPPLQLPSVQPPKNFTQRLDFDRTGGDSTWPSSFTICPLARCPKPDQANQNQALADRMAGAWKSVITPTTQTPTTIDELVRGQLVGTPTTPPSSGQSTPAAASIGSLSPSVSTEWPSLSSQLTQHRSQAILTTNQSSPLVAHKFTTTPPPPPPGIAVPLNTMANAMRSNIGQVSGATRNLYKD